MKDILKKKFLGIPMAVIAIILVAAVALGATAWFTTTLTSTGEVTVTVRPDFDYTITPTQLDFGSHSAYVGEAMSVDAWVTIENTGNQAIVGFEISATAAGTPIGVTDYGYPQYQTGIAVGGTLNFQVIVYITPLTTNTINLSGLEFVIKPHSGI